MNKASCWVALIVGLLWHASALAQTRAQPTEAERAEASVHFQRAVELFQEDAFRAALAEFERAHDIAPDYRLLYNIGQTRLRLQDYLGGVQAYEVYLSEGGSTVPAERRAQVEEALAALRDRIGRLGVSCNRDGSEVFVDDLSVGKTPISGTIPVNVGSHRVLVRAPDGVSQTRVVNVAGGDVADVSFELRPAASPLAAAPTLPPEERLSAMQRGAIVTWSAGAALLIGGTVTGVMALNAQDGLDGLVAKQGVDPKDITDKHDSIKTLALATDALIGVGAAAVVGGSVLWLLDRRHKKNDQQTDEKQSIQVSFGPRSAVLRGSF